MSRRFAERLQFLVVTLGFIVFGVVGAEVSNDPNIRLAEAWLINGLIIVSVGLAVFLIRKSIKHSEGGRNEES